jgi:RimJ/RimL family protein N-acetyltransferase
MIELRNFTNKDCECIKNNFYPNMSISDIANMIDDWNTFLYNNVYFKMFAVLSDNEIVGSVSLYGQGNGIIGAGIRIIERYRKNGYGIKAVELALEYAKQKGYTKAVAQISVNNIASIALHKKLDFSIISKYINRKGNEVYDLEKPI